MIYLKEHHELHDKDKNVRLFFLTFSEYLHMKKKNPYERWYFNKYVNNKHLSSYLNQMKYIILLSERIFLRLITIDELIHEIQMIITIFLYLNHNNLKLLGFFTGFYQRWKKGSSWINFIFFIYTYLLN